MTDEICVACGEQEAIHDGMCSDCLQMGGYGMNPDLDFVEDDAGFRTCDCEDYPCCGH